MRITRIAGYHLAYRPEVPLGNARTFIRQREFLLLEINTDAGITGWGEVFASPCAAAALIRHQMSSQILNRSALDHGEIYSLLLAMIGYDKRGASMMAISAVDMALHDIAARGFGISVAQLLGGACRKEVPCYASGPFIREGTTPYAHYTAEIEQYLQQGFLAVKPRAGISPRADATMVRQIRDAFGEEMSMMIDINQGYNRGTARQLLGLLEEYQPLWVEEPVHPEDLNGYQALSAATSCPIAGGEALGSLASVEAFISCASPAILQPDLTVCGGFTGYRKAQALADAREIPTMPHAFGTVINFYASLQMAAATPSPRANKKHAYPWVEYDPTGNPLMELLGDLNIQNGCVALPEAPGIGIQLTPEMIAPWVVNHWSVDI